MTHSAVTHGEHGPSTREMLPQAPSNPTSRRRSCLVKNFLLIFFASLQSLQNLQSLSAGICWITGKSVKTCKTNLPFTVYSFIIKGQLFCVQRYVNVIQMTQNQPPRPEAASPASCSPTRFRHLDNPKSAIFTSCLSQSQPVSSAKVHHRISTGRDSTLGSACWARMGSTKL